MKISDLVAQATLFLKNTSPSARLDAEVIISDTLDCRREDLYINSEKILNPKALSDCLQKIERRIAGEPVSYITHKKDFLNYTLYVNEGVLIPRPETELLVEYALHWVEQNSKETPLWMLDIGAGSGCIGVSILKECSNVNGVAIDIADAAIQASQVNAEKLNVQERYHLIQKDADAMDFRDFEFLKQNGFKGSFDFIVSNPPYIAEQDQNVETNVRKFEPSEALFCLDEGMEKITKWTNLAGSLLRPQGLWIFEIGAGQGRSAKAAVEASGFFEKLEVGQDYSGKDRFVIAIKKDIIHQEEYHG